MPRPTTYAILVTFRNMAQRAVEKPFIERITKNTGPNRRYVRFDQLYFDDADLGPTLQAKVGAVPSSARLKLFVSGHGYTGLDCIADQTGSDLRTISQLAALLIPALKDRASSPSASKKTEIIMVACRFGRTPDGVPGSSSAGKLYRRLIDAGVYTELVARTEDIVEDRAGRFTTAPWRDLTSIPNVGLEKKGVLRRKHPFSKVRWTYEGGKITSHIAAYDGNGTMIDAASQAGKEILWADHAVNLLLERVRTTNPRDSSNGYVDYADEQSVALARVAYVYDESSDPLLLLYGLERLLDEGNTDLGFIGKLIEAFPVPPTYAILVTFKNMEDRVLAGFIQRGEGATRGDNPRYASFERFHFDGGGLRQTLASKIASVPAEARLKIFLSGHGGVGIDYITDDSGKDKRTVRELADLLVPALGSRASDPDLAAQTEIIMLSCLFARTPDGNPQHSPAGKLYQQLIAGGVYTELVGRTESISAGPDGRLTIGMGQWVTNIPNFGKRPSFAGSKRPYSKIRWTYEDSAIACYIAAYDGKGTLIPGSSEEGKRILWADYAVSTLIKHIETKGSPGEVRVIDERSKVLERLVCVYDVMPNPLILRAKLASLVDGTGTDRESSFLGHRNPIHGLTGELPKKAAMIKEVLAAYPG